MFTSCHVCVYLVYDSYTNNKLLRATPQLRQNHSFLHYAADMKLNKSKYRDVWLFGVAGKSARKVSFEKVEAARSQVIGWTSIMIITLLLLVVVVVDVVNLWKSVRQRCRR